MRNSKKYKEMLFNAGYTLRNGAVYWLNGDAGLKASERQKFRKILAWLEGLPKMLKEKFDLSYNIVIDSNFYESNLEQFFEIYGVDQDTGQGIFYFGEPVNDVEENDGYIHHWEGFKKLLKIIDVNNLVDYLDNHFKKIEITTDDEGDYNISHTESIYGIQTIVDHIYDEANFNSSKGWEFKDRLLYTGYRNFVGCYHTSSNEDIFFWESAGDRLLALEVWYHEDTTKVVNYNWNELYSVEANPDDNYNSWIYKWDSEKMEDVPVTTYKFN